MIYRLRFFFDAGSGVCLWSANPAARVRFGYPVVLGDLPLAERTRETGRRLIERYDTSLDRSYPPDRSPWSEAESLGFDMAARDWLTNIKQELGRDFQVVDESRPARLAE